MAAHDDAEPSQQLEMQFGSDAPVVGAMRLFLQSRCAEQLARLAAAAQAGGQQQPSEEEEEEEYSRGAIAVDMHELIGFNHEVATLVLEAPSRYLRLFEHAAALEAGNRRVAVRIEHLPSHAACTRTRVPGAADVGRLVSVSGTV
ncbi:hypothetical protein GGI22_001670, partial [Coemansia erecta]